MTELNPQQRSRLGDLLPKYIEAAANEFNLAPDSPVIVELANTRSDLDLYHTLSGELKARNQEQEDLIRKLNKQVEELSHDHKTGLLLYGPAIRKSKILFQEIDANIENPFVAHPKAPNAALALVIDVEALHIINNRWGEAAGDITIEAAGTTLVETADFLRYSFRSQERREAPREDEDPRRQDVLARRQKGDELFVIFPFHETEDFTKEQMMEIVARRIEEATKDGGKKLYLHYSMAFYKKGQTPEELLAAADPKLTSQLGRYIRIGRKAARTLLGKYY